VGRPETIWLRPAHSRFTPNCGLTKCDAGRALSCHLWTHAPQQRESSFNHLIGDGKRAGRNGQAERLRSLEID
jgi:hypothetical protein